MSTKKVEAMPQLIPVLEGSDYFVELLREKCESCLRHKMGSSRVTRVPIQGFSDDEPGKVYHWATQANGEQGMYFATEDHKSVDFMYYYTSITLQHPKRSRVAEALAFRFNEHALYTRGLLPILFFEHLLPTAKAVVTDSIYSDDGKGWFIPQYRQALAAPGKYNVYAVDTETMSIAKVDQKQFWALQSRYWGSTEEFQRYRFAISLHSENL